MQPGRHRALRTSICDRTRTSSEVRDKLCDTVTVQLLSEGLQALADETRLQIIYLLMVNGEMCVCNFMPLLNLAQSNVSFHLKTLKYAGLITSRKEGRWMYYSLNRKALEQLCAGFWSVFDLSKWPENIQPASCEETSCR